MATDYVVKLADTLQDPQVPVEVPIKTEAGPILARVDRFRFDWRLGTAEVWGASLTAGSERLASVTHVSAKGIQIFDLLTRRGYSAPALVEGEGIMARIDREADGRLAFEKYLPTQKGEPGKIPFSVRLRDIRVVYTDRRGDFEPLVVSTSGVSASGIGNDWRAKTTVSIASVGAIQIDAQQLIDESLVVGGSTTGLALAPLLRAGLERDLPKELKVSEGRVTGSIRLVRSEMGRLVFRAPFEGSGKSLAWEVDDLSSANAKGVLTEKGFAGNVAGARASGRGDFSGVVAISDSIKAVGSLSARIGQLTDLPLSARKLIPRGYGGSNFSYRGRVAFSSAKDWQIDGLAKAGRVVAPDVDLTAVDLNLAADAKQIVASTRSPVRYKGVAGSGWAGYQLATNKVLAVADVPTVEVSRLPTEFRPRGLIGSVSARFVADGPVERLAIQTRAEGEFKYQSPQVARQDLGRVTLAASYRNGKVQVERATAMGGVAMVTARPTPNGDLVVDVRGLDARRLNKRLSGLVSMEGLLRPDLRNPTFKGRLEGYRLAWDDATIPAFVSDVSADRTRATISHFSALRGTTVATGRASYRYADGRIYGAADVDNFQISDIDDARLAGTVDIRKILVTGTATKPMATFQVVADELVAAGVKVSSSFVPGRYDGRDLVIGPGTTLALGGTVSVDGRYNIQSKSGSGSVNIKSLSLTELSDWAELGDDSETLGSLVNLRGDASGAATVEIESNKLKSATLSADLSDLALNRATFGAGKLTAQYDGAVVSGEASVGELDRYLSLSGLQYSVAEKTLVGRVDVNQIGVQDLTLLAGSAKDRLNYDQRQLLESARGTLSLGATVSGRLSNPNVTLEVLEANGITVSGTEVGTITAAGARNGEVLDITKFAVNGPLATATATGKIVRGGEISIDGEVRDLVISSLKVFAPSLGTIAGKVTVPFTIGGKTASPTLLASVETDGLLQKKGDGRDLAMDLSLDRVSVSESLGATGGIEIGGVWKYRGFQGDITASAPFKYPLEIPETGAVAAAITLAERPLKDIAELTDSLDPTRTVGSVKGDLSASGTRNKLDWRGAINMVASQLGIRGNDVELKDVTATATIDPLTALATINATHAGGGEITGDLSAKTAAIAGILEQVTNGELRELLDTNIDGNLSLSNFRHRQRFAGGQAISGMGDGQIKISGPVRSPLIAGNLNLSNIDGAIPAVPAVAAGGAAPLVDPRFAVSVNLGTPARLRAATADLSILGGVDLAGRLTAPVVTSELTVEGGSIRLPGGLIRLAQGGEVRFDYNGGNNESPVLDLDVEGRTSMTTNLTGSNIERYDITIRITGNLLKDGGLNFDATSDPPGLSQDRIIAMLGQTDILTSLGAGGDQRQTQTQLQNAFTGIAVPVVFESITRGLAQSLYLDYLTLDYNPFDRISVVAARSLGSGFSIQARRQLSTPDPGEPIKYDFRLVYRPRLFKGTLSRFSFSVGADEQRPLKLSVDYSTRFGKKYEGKTKGPTVIFPRPKTR